MVVKVGINGFGHIGRSILNASLKNSNIQVVAINDPSKGLDFMVGKLTCDSPHGRSKCSVPGDGNQFLVDGQPMTMFSERDPATVPWAKHGVDYVVETTGVFITPNSAHLKGGAISTRMVDSPLLVISNYKPKHQVIFNASDTTKVADGIMEDWITTIYATMATQKTANGPNGKDGRGGRSAATNTIPTCTNVTKDAPNTIPKLDGELTGFFYSISDPNVSAIDLTTRLGKPICYDGIKEVIKKPLQGDLQDTVDHSQDEMPPTDFIDDPHSSLFDAQAGISLDPYFAKTNPWCDNAFGDYSTRPMDLITQIG